MSGRNSTLLQHTMCQYKGMCQKFCVQSGEENQSGLYFPKTLIIFLQSLWAYFIPVPHSELEEK